MPDILYILGGVAIFVVLAAYAHRRPTDWPPGM
jgi:hypothetical protein